MAGKTFRNVGDHATELVVGDTLPWVGPGEFIDLSADDVKANQEKIDTGALIDVSTIVPDVVEPEVEATTTTTTTTTTKSK